MIPRNVFVNVPSRTEKQLCVWNGKNMEAFTGAREFGELYIRLPLTEVYVHAHEIRTCRKPDDIERMLAVLDIGYVDASTHTHLRGLADAAYAEIEAYKGVIDEKLINQCDEWRCGVINEREKWREIIDRELNAPDTDYVIATIRGIINNVVLKNDPDFPDFHLAMGHQIAAIHRIAKLKDY